ncbi:dTDP-4-dehydrorhamnose reductase [Thermanaerovibrio acidaminovorans]|nr:dTDP-4-dehydrorhamnose reductase [Thermanaerovibrio acidaminovorans]
MGRTLKMLKFLITGKQGQLSLAFAELLKTRGIEFLALGRHDLDISDLNSVRRVIAHYKPGAVFNGAAYNDVDKAEENRETAFLANAIGPKNLALACAEMSIPLITFSTDYVFDGKKSAPYTTEDPTCPLNAYGESKLAGEIFVHESCQQFILARVSWVFGEKGKTESNFLKKLLYWASSNKRLRIVDDQISSPSFAPDIAEAVYSLFKDGKWGLSHLCNTGFCSRYDWAKIALQTVNWSGELMRAKSREFRTAAQRPAFSALRSSYELPSWEESTLRCLSNLNL